MRSLRSASLLGALGLLAATLCPTPLAAAVQRGAQVVASPATVASGAEAQRARTKLRLDDGSAEQVIGLVVSGTSTAVQTVILNRFSPTANRLPFALDTVLILFPKTCQAGDTGLRAGMTFDLLVYLDPTGSGDPASAMLAARQSFQIEPSNRNFQKIELAAPVSVTSGDVWIGYTNTLQTGGESPRYHAALDTTSPQGRSWIFYNRSSAFTGESLATAEVRHLIDQEGIAGNWMIRARGRVGGAASGL